MNTEFKSINRDKVQEFKRNNTICEIYQKRDYHERIYFDIKIVREFVSGGDRKRGPYLQQRDCRDIVVVIMEAQEYISERHREIRDNKDFDSDDSKDFDSDDSKDFDSDDSGYSDSFEEDED